MSEVYVSTCCGGMFVPGYGPDNIVGLDCDGPILGKRLTPKEKRSRGHSLDAEVYEVPKVEQFDRDMYDAIRTGECPACGEKYPMLDLLTEVDA